MKNKIKDPEAPQRKTKKSESKVWETSASWDERYEGEIRKPKQKRLRKGANQTRSAELRWKQRTFGKINETRQAKVWGREANYEWILLKKCEDFEKESLQAKGEANKLLKENDKVGAFERKS